jgi:hypothetical protein
MAWTEKNFTFTCMTGLNYRLRDLKELILNADSNPPEQSTRDEQYKYNVKMWRVRVTIAAMI